MKMKNIFLSAIAVSTAIFLLSCHSSKSKAGRAVIGNGSLICFDERCMAVGSYTTDEDLLLPLQFFSADNGRNFTTVSNVALPIDSINGQSGALVSLTCMDESNCIAVGAYINESEAFVPLITFSTDGGLSYRNSVTVPLPFDAETGEDLNAVLTDLNCNGEVCKFIGNYTSTRGVEAVPLLCFTDDLITYSCNSNVTLADNTDYNSDGGSSLNGFTCEGDTCLGVGNTTLLPNDKPILVGYSIDNGQTYTTSTSSVALPTNTQISGGTNALNDVICEGEICRAVGSYSIIDIGNIVPLLAFSEDAGLTFTTTTNISVPPGAEPIPQFLLTALSCTGSDCIAAGQYRNSEGGTLPFVTFSSDEGQSYSEFANFSLPNNIATGDGSSTAIGFPGLN